MSSGVSIAKQSQADDDATLPSVTSSDTPAITTEIVKLKQSLGLHNAVALIVGLHHWQRYLRLAERRSAGDRVGWRVADNMDSLWTDISDRSVVLLGAGHVCVEFWWRLCIHS